jgi:anti-sigma factor RsiW
MSAEMHPIEDIRLLVEGNLPMERDSALRDHLSACGRCRAELDAMRKVRSALHASLPRVAVPEDVTRRIRAALEAEARASTESPLSDRPAVSRRTFIQRGAIALAVAAGIAAVFFRMRPRDLVAEAESDFLRFSSDRFQLGLATSTPSTLEDYLRAGDLGFSTRVFDFGMMGYSLVGGSVHETAGRDAALFAYRAADGRPLVCQMYVGSLEQLREPASPRLVNGIDFRVYALEAVTLVFWEEGRVMCVLAAQEDPAAALELAVAKAVRI